MSNATVSLILLAESAALRRGLADSGRAVRGFAAGARSELQGLGATLNSFQGRLAGIGIGLGAGAQVLAAARLDRNLIGYAQTAGVALNRTDELRAKLYALSRETGRPLEELEAGFSRLIAGGLTWDQAVETIHGVNVAMGVTKAGADGLASALTVAGASFDFDLARPGQALELLDKMTVAGRLANAELQDLSPIFATVGASAQRAGLSFEKTLALIEALSIKEKDPGRLSTLTDATLRLFTDRKLSMRAGRAAGVDFFDRQGGRREIDDVLGDMAAKFQKLTTEDDRSKWVQRVFGQADRRTQRGIYDLLAGGATQSLRDFTRQIEEARGTLEKNLPESLDNLADQVGRLNTAIGYSIDKWTEPVRRRGARAIGYALDKDGLNLSGTQLLAGGAAATILALVLGRRMKGWAGRLLSSGGDLAAGVATGKALEAAAGVTPVFVTNWPGGGPHGGPKTSPGTILDQWGNPILIGGGKAGPGAALATAGLWGLVAAMTSFSAYALHQTITGDRRQAGAAPGSNPHLDFSKAIADVTQPGMARIGQVNARQLAELHQVAQLLGIKNEINLDVHMTPDGRTVAASDDPNTTITVPLRRPAW